LPVVGGGEVLHDLDGAVVVRDAHDDQSPVVLRLQPDQIRHLGGVGACGTAAAQASTVPPGHAARPGAPTSTGAFGLASSPAGSISSE
jgi:hypothetical protein